MESQGFKSLDPMTTGAEIRATSHHILQRVKNTSDPVLNTFFIWHRILETYTKCSLTQDTDKLVAISAITQNIQPLVNDTYLAGLWVRYLPYQLLWFRYFPKGNRRNPSKSYVAPTWSWASVSGVCLFFQNIDIHEERFMIQILGSKVVRKGSDPMGQISYGCIKLRCWLMSCSPVGIFSYCYFFDLGKGKNVNARFDSESDLTGVELFFMPIVECPDRTNEDNRVVHGLILLEAEAGKGFYRAGMFEASSFNHREGYEYLTRPTYEMKVADCQHENIMEHSVSSSTLSEYVRISGNDFSSVTSSKAGGITEEGWTEVIIQII